MHACVCGWTPTHTRTHTLKVDTLFLSQAELGSTRGRGSSAGVRCPDVLPAG